MNKDQLITFNNSDIGELKGAEIDGEPWFLAGSVCNCLALNDSGRQVDAILERFKIAEIKGSHTMRPLLETAGGKQKVLFISEAVLYELVFQSRKKKAIKFRAWITTEVLPSLRRHGQYRMNGKLIRRSLTDAIKESGENERMKGHGYSNYSILLNKSLGLPNKVDRDLLPPDILEKLARRENTIQALITEGKDYDYIKDFIQGLHVDRIGQDGRS